MNVSLTMIVRDEEKNLPHCLRSVAGMFDETVVVDTGSTDRTRAIAREFGARVVDFPWVDSFAAARNAALDHATGDYAFWLDADDVVDPPERAKLEALFAELRPGDEAGYLLRCDSLGDGKTDRQMRLFPLRWDVRWTYRVHEQILPAVQQAKIPVRWPEVTVRHTGYADPECFRRKRERNYRLMLMRSLVDDPCDAFPAWHSFRLAVALERPPLMTLMLRAHVLALCGPDSRLEREVAALWEEYCQRKE